MSGFVAVDASLTDSVPVVLLDDVEDDLGQIKPGVYRAEGQSGKIACRYRDETHRFGLHPGLPRCI